VRVLGKKWNELSINILFATKSQRHEENYL